MLPHISRRTAGALLFVVVAVFLLLPGPTLGQAVCPTPGRLVETLRLGSVAGPLNLIDPISLTVGGDGRIYLADLFATYVQVLSPDGRAERTIGRAGLGPGEFRGYPSLIGFRGDTLWVSDEESMYFFMADGRFLRSVTFRTVAVNESSSFSPGWPLADGSFFGRRRQGGGAGVGGLSARAFSLGTLPTRRFSSSGEVVGVPISLDWRTRLVQLPGEVFLEHPLYAELNVAPGAGGPSGMPTVDGSALLAIGELIQGAETSFELLRVGLSGDTFVQRRVPFTPRMVSSAEADSLRAWFAAWWGGDYRLQGVGPALPAPIAAIVNDPARFERQRREARSAISFPQSHPPVRAVVAGEDGTIWLQREFRLDGVERWDVYDADARFLGFVEFREAQAARIPWFSRFRILRASADEVWGVALDAFEVPRLNRYPEGGAP